MAKRSFSGISVGHSRAVKRRKGMGGFASQINRRSASSLASKVNKILSQQERKTFDVVASVPLVASTAQIIPLSNIPLGDDFNQRDGRKVAYVSTQMRYTVANPGAVAGIWRVIVLCDKQSNGITPVAADILTVATNPRSPLTIEFKERFRVLHDNYCSLGKGDFDFTSTTGAMAAEYFRKVPEDLAQAEYGGIGAVPTTSSILMLVLAETSGTFSYYHRLRFTDS